MEYFLHYRDHIKNCDRHKYLESCIPEENERDSDDPVTYKKS